MIYINILSYGLLSFAIASAVYSSDWVVLTGGIIILFSQLFLSFGHRGIADFILPYGTFVLGVAIGLKLAGSSL